VREISRFTSLYMAAIDPFRKLIVYPTIIQEAARAQTMEESFADTITRISARLRELCRPRPSANLMVFAMLALATAGLAGCSAHSMSPDFGYAPSHSWESYRQSANGPAAPHIEVASWYGPGFQGRRTSSGERFNEYDMTAASKTLPLGSEVRVTNPANGRSVNVRIDDRGPFVGSRGIDLSKGAAERLGMKRTGVAPVVVSSAGGATSYEPSSRDETDSHHWLPREPPHWHWRHRHRSYREVREHHSRRNPQTVWNPVGYWLETSLSRL
jgi:Lytic transglycolase